MAHTRRIPIIVIAGILLGLILCGLGCWVSVQYWLYEEEIEGSGKVLGEQVYSIEPHTIPAAIDAPDFLKLIAVDKDPKLGLLPIPTREDAAPHTVTSDDFYRIAHRVSQTWGELPLTLVSFSTPCEYASYGPQEMWFEFNRLGGVSTYTLEVNVGVDVLNSWVYTSAYRYREHFRYIPKRNIFDWPAIKVQADQALRIAEENGGRAFRESHDCGDVAGFLEPSEWGINYLVSHKPVLTFHIDWRTGEITKKIWAQGTTTPGFEELPVPSIPVATPRQ